MLNAAQIEVRRTGVGASEVSALADINPYATPLDVWLTKPTPSREPLVTQTMTHPDSPIAVGEELEEALVGMLGRRVNLEFVRPTSTFRHARYRHVLASPDALALGRRGGEIKVVGSRMAHHWTDGLPDYVRTQVAQNMSVMGADVWHVGALVGGNDFRVYTVERDRELEEKLGDLCETWWAEHIDGDAPPPVSDQDARRRYLLARYPGSEATRCRTVADAEIAEAAERLGEIDRDVHALEDEKKGIQNALCEIVGGDYGIEGTWGKFLWYPVQGRVNWQAVAEQIAGGPVDEELIAKHRGDGSRVPRLYEPKKTKERRR